VIYLPLVLVGLLLLLVLPLFPWSRGWGWAPAGMVGVVLLTVLLFLVAELARGAG
jgi:hypothetical protein